MIKIFEKDGKTNFVDHNNLVIGYDMERSCCEEFGWFIMSNKKLKIDDKAYGADEVFKENIKIDPEKFDLSDYWFDPNFIKQDCLELDDCHRYAIFRMRKEVCTTKDSLYLVLYNFHNGYYSHGFSFSGENADGRVNTIIEGYL